MVHEVRLVAKNGMKVLGIAYMDYRKWPPVMINTGRETVDAINAAFDANPLGTGESRHD